MTRVLCRCGHSVYDHSDFYCHHCGCSESCVLHRRLLDSERIRKMCTQLAAAESAEKLHAVVIHSAVERTA